jgi:hypothetical protein
MFLLIAALARMKTVIRKVELPSSLASGERAYSRRRSDSQGIQKYKQI